MRIAQLAPPWIAVPPAGYGGTEWVVQQLCDGLPPRGHEVVLYAAGDSHTAAELRAHFPRAMTELMQTTSIDVCHVRFALDDMLADGDFDLVHDHSGFLVPAFRRFLDLPPVLHTIHCSFNAETLPFYTRFGGEVACNAISEYQRSQGPPGMDWAGVVYNAIAVEDWPFVEEKDDYLLAFGRVCEAKGFHLAIEVARRTGRRLIMAGVVQRHSADYFHERVAPHVDGEQILFEGEVSLARKRELFAHAHAYVFPIAWPEPFGLVMIEALATGTPVVALRQGSVPEVVTDGRTGFVCDDLDGLVAAVGRVGEIDPQVCRAEVERRFSVARMVGDYEAVYRRLVARR
jgi:glycosyltransferase involved in cell wall biosynthesis